MGIKNFVNEFQDYFFIKRSLLERLDSISLSPSSLEACFLQTEQILKDFQTNLNFIDLESKEVLVEVQDAIESLNNKLDRINNYASAIKTINSSERDVKNIIDIKPYIFNKSLINWESSTSSLILKPESSYKDITSYSTVVENNKGFYKFIVSSDYACKYITINKNYNVSINKVICYDNNMNQLSISNVESNTTQSLLTIDTKTRYVSVITDTVEGDVTITPLSYYHTSTSVIDLEEHTYSKGNNLLFKSNTDIPYGCFIQIYLEFIFKDINGNITNTCNKWYSVNNDGLIVLQKKDVTKEKVFKVWKDTVFKDITDLDSIKKDDYVLCKALDTELVITSTESSFIIKENKSNTITIKPTLYLYSLYNKTQTPRISNLIGIMKNVN